MENQISLHKDGLKKVLTKVSEINTHEEDVSSQGPSPKEKFKDDDDAFQNF